MYVHHPSCRKSGVMSRTLKWLFCTAWHNSEGMAPPGLASRCHKKHLRLLGEASKKETRRAASSMSLSTELWHTHTSYFRVHLTGDVRADCGSGGLLDAVGVFSRCNDEEDDDINEDAADTLLIEVVVFFVISHTSCCGGTLCWEDTLAFMKSLWNQPKARRRQTVFITD